MDELHPNEGRTGARHRSLDGRVAVITGAGRGIGRAIALRLAAEGATIAVSSRTPDELETLVDEVGAGLTVVADAASASSARLPISRAIETFGRVDVLVNNVGGDAGGDPDPFGADDSSFDRTLALNLSSAWWASTAALPGMRRREFGRIINIGSAASRHAVASVAYTAAKHGLVGLTRQLAVDCAPHGISVNCICPGWTMTSAIEGASQARLERARSDNAQRRILEPEEIAGMVALLSGPDGRGLTGQIINIDGGFRV